jgi:hypothetical protein
MTFPLEGTIGWFCGARWMQKNVSLRSRLVNGMAPYFHLDYKLLGAQ